MPKKPEATINTLFGLDMIKRLGFDYAKILGICLLLAVMSGVAGGIFNAVPSP
jgi:hypothetical protein